MQSDLDALRDMLSNENCSIDANTLLGVNIMLKLFLHTKTRKIFCKNNN